MNQTFQTPDDVAASMATTSGAMGPGDWSDFFSMPFDQQKACGQMYKDAIFAAAGQSGWTIALNILGTAATVFGDASGIGTAFQALRSL